MTKTINCLFLDDDENRHEAFQKAIEIFQHVNQDKTIELNVTHVRGYFEAQKALREKQFHVVYLDHDLADCHSHADYEESGYDKYYYTGTDLAAHIRNLPGDYVRQLNVIVHSVNPDGAKNIETILKNHVQQIVRKEIWTALEDLKNGTF